MIYFIVNLFVPPLALMLYSDKHKLTLTALLLWCLSFYLFLEHSVLKGLVLYIVLSIISFSITKIASKRNFPKDLVHYSYALVLVSSTILLTATIVKRHHDYIVKKEESLLAAKKYSEGNAIFNQKCGVCHRLNDDNYVGPSLRNIVQREAGSYPNYNYSENLGKADFLWTHENLKKYLVNQNAFIPGTRMIISPLEDSEIDLIIGFLEQSK